MKIIVKEIYKITPFSSLFSAENRTGKEILKTAGFQYFENSNLFELQKMGFEITHTKKKTHKQRKIS